MAKYDIPRKSMPVRHAAYGGPPKYFPTVRRQALPEAGWQPQQACSATSALAALKQDATEALALVDTVEDDDALPVPEAGVPKETQIVSRRPTTKLASPPPLPGRRPVVDPMTILARATVWGDRRRAR